MKNVLVNDMTTMKLRMRRTEFLMKDLPERLSSVMPSKRSKKNA